MQHWGLNVWQPDQHTTWADNEEDESCDDEVIDTDEPLSSEPTINKPQVIQIEFMIGDYDEAYGLATFLRSKGVDLGRVLIQSMKEYAN